MNISLPPQVAPRLCVYRLRPRCGLFSSLPSLARVPSVLDAAPLTRGRRGWVGPGLTRAMGWTTVMPHACRERAALRAQHPSLVLYPFVPPRNARRLFGANARQTWPRPPARFWFRPCFFHGPLYYTFPPQASLSSLPGPAPGLHNLNSLSDWTYDYIERVPRAYRMLLTTSSALDDGVFLFLGEGRRG